MKQRIWLIVVSCFCLLVTLGLYWGNLDFLESPVPVPSHSGGYYDAPFTLTLSCPSTGTIYYTTDGSTPTADSLVYSGGIPIYDRSAEPNVYNAIRNVIPDWQTYSAKDDPVPKGTVVRALYVGPLGGQSEIMTETYFVGLSQPEEGYTLNLVFEYDDLFGDDGIYVTGKEYDEWLLNGGVGEAPEANFLKRTEVPVTTQLIQEGGYVLNQRAGLRIVGNSSRSYLRKRFAFFAREEYSGQNVFDAPIFDGISTHSFMTKDTQMDAMVYQMVADRDVSVQRSIPVRFYLNGEYWQDAYILERYDKQYFRQHYNVSDPLRVKDAWMEKEFLETSPIDYYGEYMCWVEETDFSDPKAWETLLSETDVQSYIDYISINYFLCNYDFSAWHNTFMWRSDSKGKSPWADQRWRWCIYDVDAFMNVEYQYPDGPAAEIDIFCYESKHRHEVVNEGILFRALKENPDYRRQFVTSFLDIGNNNFAPERVAPVLEQYGLDLSWKEDYFQNRFAYAAGYLAREFDLTGTLETVAIHTSNPEMGDVVVNTSHIDLSSGAWSGQYFTDYPITVTATARDGYQFLGWKGDADTAENALNLSVDGGITLEAVFAKEK